jgi:hypothetical protein
MNMLQMSVLSKLKDENIHQEIVALVIIGKIINTSLMKLVDNKTFATHILDLNKHFHQLQIDLNTGHQHQMFFLLESLLYYPIPAPPLR